MTQILLDELQIFCPRARHMYEQALVSSLPSTKIHYLGQMIDALFTHLKEHDKALQSLTPGGSEYVNDRERCVRYVIEMKASLRERAVSFCWVRSNDFAYIDPCGTIWRQPGGALYAQLDDKKGFHVKLPEYNS